MSIDHRPQDSSDARSLFAGLLASSIHDMKNSLGVVLNSMDELAGHGADGPTRRRVAGLQQEARRIRNQLVQLLSLYKLEHSALALNMRGQSIEEFLEDCLLRDKPLLDARPVEADLDCPPDLQWCFDPELTAGVVANALHNAVRHARGRVSLAAEETQGWLRLAVNDDGDGFPAAMTGTARAYAGGVDFDSGSTGLGLCFSATAAGLHARAGRSGYIRLENGGALGGGLFLVYLP